MLGNDIVDLKKAKAESNWKRNGYLGKIFNLDEQEQILNSEDPNQLVWLLWSMKEAAYKIIHRESLQRLYNPIKFSCQLNVDEGIVIFEGRIYYTKSITTENLVHTLASTKKEKLALIKTYYAENTHNYISEFNTKPGLYYIEKNADGIPNLLERANGESCFTSISHHGQYLAILLPTS